MRSATLWKCANWSAIPQAVFTSRFSHTGILARGRRTGAFDSTDRDDVAPAFGRDRRHRVGHPVGVLTDDALGDSARPPLGLPG